MLKDIKMETYPVRICWKTILRYLSKLNDKDSETQMPIFAEI